jgi:hypothetical protein
MEICIGETSGRSCVTNGDVEEYTLRHDRLLGCGCRGPSSESWEKCTSAVKQPTIVQSAVSNVQQCYDRRRTPAEENVVAL